MNYRKNMKEKLAKLIFLELNKEFAEKSFQVSGLKEMEEDIFLPLSPEYIAENISKDLTRNLPMGEFIKGMYYCLGADPDFKYNAVYKRILASLRKGDMVKGLVAKLLKEKKNEEALIYVLGLYEAEGEGEVLENALALLEEMAITNPDYIDALIEYADLAIGKGILPGYLFKGSALRLKGDNTRALVFLKEYLVKGGVETLELTQEIDYIERRNLLKDAENILFDDPKGFLEMTLPILSTEEDNPKLLLQIAVAYRIMGNHEKAIYYLNDALAIDDGYLDVINELGINFAALGDYHRAIEYFRPLFEKVRTIEIVTNLIMCYINIGDLDMAKKHIEIAEVIDQDDEILKDIKKMLDIE
ncbi:MAG TPA: tetratricopeptide repeat protein [Clostridiaceae bacterium]|nr:tetratricopeptide repeat protein [Clostridiaceae bacterium]